MTSIRPAPRAPARGARFLSIVALGPVLVIVWQSTLLFQRDLVFTAAEAEVSFWGRGEYRPTPQIRQQTEVAVNRLVAAAPSQPDYLALAANLYAWQGYWAEDPAREAAYDRRAVQAQYAAQASRPAYRPGWELLETYARRADDTARVDLARERLGALVDDATASRFRDPAS